MDYPSTIQEYVPLTYLRAVKAPYTTNNRYRVEKNL